MTFRYYVLDEAGEPLAVDDFLVWATWFETSAAARIVKQTAIGPYRVSTVFLGLDHSLGYWPGHEDSQPILFETAVFRRGSGWRDFDMRRHATRAEAVEGHEITCALVRVDFEARLAEARARRDRRRARRRVGR